MKPVYVVEDDALIRRYLRDLLERVAGWTVELRDGAGDLVAELRRRPAALVLLDITLPAARLDGRPADGVVLCRRLKEDLGPAAPPVVLLTAHAVEGDPERFLAASGADAYQAKPIYDEDAFLARCGRLMGGGGSEQETPASA